ncbi:MAG: transposase [Lachnospiraceae bacterium]|nr:transposase [Lachnospiraceae bacterium]
MRVTPIPAEEQFRLIMECRASGLSDYEWCLKHDVKPVTIYNWVKRLRKEGYGQIPDNQRGGVARKQEIVKVEMSQPCTKEVTADCNPVHNSYSIPVRRWNLTLSGVILHIPNGADPVMLRQTLHILKELSCQAIFQ